MNKQELVKALQKNLNDTDIFIEGDFKFNQDETDAVINAISKVISDAVLNGDKVKIPRVGTFGSKETKAKIGHNPSTLEKIDILASKKVTFKVEKSFKDDVKATV